MTKRETLADPNSCFNRAADDEEIFVLLGRDMAAPDGIRHWVAERIRRGKNQPSDAQLVEALECAERMEAARPAEPQPKKVAGRRSTSESA